MAFGNRPAGRDRLAANIDHVRLSAVIEMGEFRHNDSIGFVALNCRGRAPPGERRYHARIQMSIRVKLFASLAESLGRRETSLPYRHGLTVASVWTEISGEATLPSGVLVALNMAYCDSDTVLSDGDEVAYFPPVTGG